MSVTHIGDTLQILGLIQLFNAYDMCHFQAKKVKILVTIKTLYVYECVSNQLVKG